MRDGDIFRWTWKPELGRDNHAPFGDYHCKSQIAIFEDGVLSDTFWSIGSSGGRVVRQESVDLHYLGNRHDMTTISAWELPYYRREDIVDTRHPNSSIAPIYLKAGASKDAGRMKEEASYRLETARGEKASAERAIERLEEALRLIESGSLDAVYF